VIEVFFGIDDAKLVSGSDGSGVAVDGLRGQRVCARVYDQSQTVAHDKTCVDAPGSGVAEAGDGVAAGGEAHA